MDNQVPEKIAQSIDRKLEVIISENRMLQEKVSSLESIINKDVYSVLEIMNERVSSMEDIIISPRTRLPTWSSKYIPSIMVGIGIASFLSLYLMDNNNNNKEPEPIPIIYLNDTCPAEYSLPKMRR